MIKSDLDLNIQYVTYPCVVASFTYYFAYYEDSKIIIGTGIHDVSERYNSRSEIVEILTSSLEFNYKKYMEAFPENRIYLGCKIVSVSIMKQGEYLNLANMGVVELT